MNQLIHTTAGVRDIFGDEYERKSILMERISSLFGSYGYKHIQTPSIEFYPVFDKDKGTIHSSQLYKIIDKEGHTLVLRPDFTPSIARAVSMYFADEKLPLRLCYQGNVFLNNANYRGRLNESTEMGVELINYDAPEADAEHLYQFGIEIGLAFQLQDDLLDVYGNAATFGKNIGGDILCDKKTYLLINAFRKADERQQAILAQWIGVEGVDPQEKIASVKAIYDELKLKELCEEKMRECYEAGMAHLEALTIPAERLSVLKGVCAKLMNRES